MFWARNTFAAIRAGRKSPYNPIPAVMWDM